MIISCEKCNKKFDISDSLIPDEGRFLECGSCSYQWHYRPQSINKMADVNRDDDKNIILKKDNKKQKKEKFKKKNIEDEVVIETPTKKKKEIGLLSYLLILTISFIALILLIDTFKLFFIKFIPQIDFYLSSLYESLRDILLFFKDLIT